MAIASLSFTARARGDPANGGARSDAGAGSLPPVPTDAPYLCNMAVDAAHRRKGLARALLSACDDLVVEMGGADVWLHVRANDAAATALYESAGYDEMKRESAMRRFFSADGGGVVLMRKELVPGGGECDIRRVTGDGGGGTADGVVERNETRAGSPVYRTNLYHFYPNLPPARAADSRSFARAQTRTSSAPYPP